MRSITVVSCEVTRNAYLIAINTDARDAFYTRHSWRLNCYSPLHVVVRDDVPKRSRLYASFIDLVTAIAARTCNLLSRRYDSMRFRNELPQMNGIVLILIKYNRKTKNP